MIKALISSTVSVREVRAFSLFGNENQNQAKRNRWPQKSGGFTMYLLQKFFQANNNPRIHLITSMLFITRKDALKEMHKQVKIVSLIVF